MFSWHKKKSNWNPNRYHVQYEKFMKNETLAANYRRYRYLCPVSMNSLSVVCHVSRSTE
jgi:hypothetical protein